MRTFLRVFYFIFGLACAIISTIVVLIGAVIWFADVFWLVSIALTFVLVPLGLLGIVLGVGLMIDMCHGFE